MFILKQMIQIPRACLLMAYVTHLCKRWSHIRRPLEKLNNSTFSCSQDVTKPYKQQAKVSAVYAQHKLPQMKIDILIPK